MVQYTVFNVPSFSCGVYPVLPVGGGRVCISTEVLDFGHRALQKCSDSDPHIGFVSRFLRKRRKVDKSIHVVFGALPGSSTEG